MRQFGRLLGSPGICGLLCGFETAYRPIPLSFIPPSRTPFFLLRIIVGVILALTPVVYSASTVFSDEMMQNYLVMTVQALHG